MKNPKNKRRDFLKNVYPTVAMAFLGFTVLESCSSGDDDVNIGGGSGTGNGGGVLNCYATSLSGNTLKVTV